MFWVHWFVPYHKHLTLKRDKKRYLSEGLIYFVGTQFWGIKHFCDGRARSWQSRRQLWKCKATDNMPKVSRSVVDLNYPLSLKIKYSSILKYGWRATLYRKWRNQLQTGRGNIIPGSTIKWLHLLTLWKRMQKKKKQYAGDKTSLISILMWNKLHMLLHIST